MGWVSGKVDAGWVSGKVDAGRDPTAVQYSLKCIWWRLSETQHPNITPAK